VDNGPTTLDAATLLVAILALVMSLVALYYARRAAVANEDAAVATERQADVAERAEEQARMEAEANAVRWRVNRLGTAALQLSNDGPDSAYDVRVLAPTAAQIHSKPLPDGETVRGYSSVNVWLSQHAGVEGEMTVLYRLQHDGPERTWSHPL
jgi:cell division protein FtsL